MAEEKDYVIISLKHSDFGHCPTTLVLWSSDYSGYTTDLEKAGRYSRKELEDKFGGIKHYRFIDEPVDGFLEREMKDSVFVKVEDLNKMGFQVKTVVQFQGGLDYVYRSRDYRICRGILFGLRQ